MESLSAVFSTMENLDFVVFFGTILFFALLHTFPPDGRRWVKEELQPEPKQPAVVQVEEEESDKAA